MTFGNMFTFLLKLTLLSEFNSEGQIKGLDQPNNIDVAYGFRWGHRRFDVAVATERCTSRLRIFRIDSQTRRLYDITDLSRTCVFADSQAESAMPMGIALYRQARTHEIYAIVLRKTKAENGYLHQ